MIRKNKFLNFKIEEGVADNNDDGYKMPVLQGLNHHGDKQAQGEFQENVMHILDRSHVKYKLHIDNGFIVDSQAAKRDYS